ncbi:Uncharacterised protein [Mycobacteroides abscessus subsp. abscessus]|nr:Uncharacterised protein [Mycobacteroides abscessus subsp. abscessus]
MVSWLGAAGLSASIRSPSTSAGRSPHTTAGPVDSTDTATVMVSDSRHRKGSGSSVTHARAAGGRRDAPASAPTNGAANTTSCQRPVITASANAAPVHAASADINADARQVIIRKPEAPADGATARRPRVRR